MTAPGFGEVNIDLVDETTLEVSVTLPEEAEDFRHGEVKATVTVTMPREKALNITIDDAKRVAARRAVDMLMEFV